MTQLLAPPACERCGWMTEPYALACPRCGALTHRAELERLSAEAIQLEPVDPAASAARWRRCLELLPRDAAQYVAIYQRFVALIAAAQAGGGGAYAEYPGGAHAGYRAAPDDPPLVAVLKTTGSMLLSILVYAMFVPGTLAGRLLFATGFVVLILVHELGHVAAMRYYGLSAGPPIFVPVLGALIRLRQAPANAKVEAIVGIGGPLLGTVGALACYGLYRAMPPGSAADLVHVLAHVGFMLNLFNLLPVPPLDGGRITAAMSPKIWVLGMAGLAALIVQEVLAGHGAAVVVLVLVLTFALPRVRGTLARRAAGAAADPYYAISPAARRAIATLYVGLGVLLVVMRFVTRDALR
jgi:Zn-dependent protease